MRRPVVLITGANGEIGHGLIDRLAEDFLQGCTERRRWNEPEPARTGH
jgi:NAD(P)-dependent dehydrogenase (short-subunit alcohol dehydrogenase family)